MVVEWGRGCNTGEELGWFKVKVVLEGGERLRSVLCVVRNGGRGRGPCLEVGTHR